MAIFGLMTVSGGSESARVLVLFGAKVNGLIARGEVWRLVTPIFLHIGILHLLVNTYALYQLGPLAELLSGHGRFGLLYLLTGISGNFLSFVFTPGLSAGASGAIFGIIGALLSFLMRHRARLTPGGRSLFVQLALVAAFNFAYGLSVPGIDNWAHLGGFLGGFAFGWLIWPHPAQVR